jgi:Hypervirulence associated proteins TUDOR domain
MPKTFMVGDHVRWNSEAGRVSGIIIKKLRHDTNFKGYTHHASREAPQYLIKSDKTDHLAIPKGTSLELVHKQTTKIQRKTLREQF